MTTMDQKDNRVEEAQGNLIEQFQGRSNVEATVEAFAEQSQDVEDAGFEILTETTTANSEGVQLDGLADIVGIERGSSDDTELRSRIEAEILSNQASGGIEELIEILDTLGATSIELTEAFPAKIEIYLADSYSLGELAASVTNRSRAGGVGLKFTWYDSTNVFTFDTAGQGFDQGELAGQITY